MTDIREITADPEKEAIARTLLEALPEWFGLPESREAYITDSAGRPFFCAVLGEEPVGFLYLKPTGKDTVELAVMGVRREFHRRGIGRALFECARQGPGIGVRLSPGQNRPDGKVRAV